MEGIREGSREREAAEAVKQAATGTRMLILSRAASKFPFNVSADLASPAP